MITLQIILSAFYKHDNLQEFFIAPNAYWATAE